MLNSLPQDALQLSHMGFAVHDIDLIANYYQEVLDFKVTDQGRLGNTDLRFMSRSDKEHHQIVIARMYWRQDGKDASPGFGEPYLKCEVADYDESIDEAMK